MKEWLQSGSSAHQGLKVKEYVRVGFSLTKAREGEERYSARHGTTDNMLLSCVLEDQNP